MDVVVTGMTKGKNSFTFVLSRLRRDRNVRRLSLESERKPRILVCDVADGSDDNF